MSQNNRVIVLWLGIVCITIFSMIVVGGITRLTDSGLSMVEWKPLMGVMPPSSESEWQSTFDAYKAYPQYQKVNHAMDLEGFKSIFYWEYGHRVLGRLIGMIYFLPLILLLMLGKIPKSLTPKLLIGLALGGGQGLMGWYMVKSGLVDIPRVSHLRLAAHLSLALIILAYLSWLIFDLLEIKRIELGTGLRRLITFTSVLLAVQILYGAFVAGNRAGFGYNTYPLMNGELIPSLAWQLSPFWHNLIDNNAMLQFIHRWLGFSVFVSVLAIVVTTFKQGLAELKPAALVLLLVVCCQFLLGVITLLEVVPIGLASLHQAGACVLLVVMMYVVYVSQAETV